MSRFDETVTLDQAAAEKLQHEEDHLAALQRMATLAPYYEWVRDLFGAWMGSRVLDAGCGVGNFMNVIAERSEYVLGVDLSSENLKVVQERFAGQEHVECARMDLDAVADELAARGFDTVVCLDVLEHIEDDLPLVRSLARIVTPGGHVLIKVPACPWLFGSVDIASDHFRRYTKKLLHQRMQEAGLEILMLQYMNLSGVLPYFLKSRVLRRRTNFSRSFAPGQLERIRRLMPLVRTIDRITGPPVGQSLILAARKPQ